MINVCPMINGKNFLKLSLIIYFLMYLLVIANMHVCAHEKYSFEGCGTQYDPYLITSYEDICALRDLVDAGNNYAGTWFKQTSDIEFPAEEIWNPIGDLKAGIAFKGYYNGNGHTISNIYCEDQYAGLFSFLGGEVRNLGIESGTFQGDTIGSITSHGTEAACIVNCYNKADIVGDARAGGITDNFPGQIIFCWNQGKVSGTSENTLTAGICSYGNPQIMYCYDAGTDKLVNDATFSGSVTDSVVLPRTDTARMLEQMYEQMWNAYTDGGVPQGTDKKVSVSRGTIVFMCWKDGEIVFDSEYEPDLFRAEKEKNKEDFLKIYDTRFEFSGTGTEEDPFQISTYEDIARLRDCVDIGVTYRSCYFEQTEDIDFPEGVNWDPIGDVKKVIPFSGVYDGKGHVLSNIYCEDQYAGVFSYLDGEVRNLGIESGVFKGETVGSITSHGGSEGSIINCYNKADVVGSARAGGIADNFGGKILFCWNLGKISRLQDHVFIGGITSYGAQCVEYCHSISGDYLVWPQTFSGTQIGSSIVGKEEIADALCYDYNAMPAYISNNTIDLKKTVFLAMDGETLAYDPAFVPNQIRTATVVKRFPEYLLIGIAMIMGVITCIIVYWALDPAAIKAARGGVKQQYREGLSIPCSNTVRQYYLSAFLTIAILLFSLYSAGYVLNSKHPAGILNLTRWEKDAENRKTDILFLGSSTLSCNIELAELWERFGIAGYCLGGGGMSMYDKYYRLLEAEKTAQVRMCVIDAKACTQSTEYRDYEFTTENVSSLKWSMNKKNYVRTAIDPQERLYYFLEFPLYHDRYHQVSKWDYKNSGFNGEDDKGTWTVMYGNKCDPVLVSAEDIVTYRAFDVKQEYYLRKIMEHCLEKDIQLLIIKTPNANRKMDQPIYNTVEMIAKEYGVSYLDFNLHDEEVGLVASDFYNDANHLNIEGARKCADFFGEYLVSHYDLPDHRSDADYASWDRFAANRENLYLRAITDNEDYFKELQRDNKNVMVFPYRLAQNESETYLKIQKQMQAILHFDWDEEDALYGEENTKSFPFGDNEVVIMKDYRDCEINVNNENNIKVSSPGLLLVIYDSVNDEIADIVEFERDNGYALKHLYNP